MQLVFGISSFVSQYITAERGCNNVQQQKIKKNIVNNENINPIINTANISNKKLNTSAGNSTETKIDKNNKNNVNENKEKSKKKEKPMTTKNGMNVKMSGNQSSSEVKSGNVSGGKKKLGKPKKEFDDDDDDFDSDSEDDDVDDVDDDDEDEDDDANNSDYYNVRKNNSDGQQHKIEKIKQTQNIKKTKTIKEPRIQTKPEKTQKRMGKTAINRKRQKHEILLKLITSSWNYLLVFLKWLYSLIIDVVYLSFGIIYDRLLLGYQAVRQFYTNIRSEIKSNSGKPGVWLKNMWKKFDGKFERKSKWAFWRYFSERKKLREQEQVNKNLFKDGKLPTTADEAMKSLLNCKGKDAYSILGVSPNCSQEQIRKHYKKIAVLVHPDKNKQAGAEEAFKILQRSFELIGETESRKRYDLSLAEALNAEKAFSELNDLLVQLQTKISEAANTIRCSSCCLRHPRRPTSRKPFSARECSTCKIRHPAREGDIWAETTMLGLRWKYLALMEGVVYDITEWANCQKTQLSHLQPNSCVVQYKIVLGGNQQNQTQSQQTSQFEREKHKKDNATANDPSFDDFLNNIYAGQTQTHHNPNTRRRYKRN